MANGQVRITPDVAEVLSKGNGAGKIYRLPPGHLDRKLYIAAAKVLEALGGKWNRKAGAFLGSEGFHSKVRDALSAGHAVDADKRDAFFRTPPAVAAKVVELLGALPLGARVLEPSCGEGALLVALVEGNEWEPFLVIATELNADRAAAAADAAPWASARIYNEDFLTVPAAVYGGKFTHILMNPPWGAGREYAHVLHALALLAPGGRLVAVLPQGVCWRDNKRAHAFCAALSGAGTYDIHDLPAHSFRSSGTDVAACILVLDKES